MDLQTMELNGVKIAFNQEKTKQHRTSYNEPCDCQDCRNYYQYVADNRELVAFLNSFGVDYHCAEELMTFALGEKPDSKIQHIAYYTVFGTIEKEIKLEHDHFGMDISFEKAATDAFDRTAINTDCPEPYFWIVVQDIVPYVLAEKREMPESTMQKFKTFVKALFRR